VVWTSNAATEALLAGVPVFSDGPHLVTEGAAERGLEHLERPTYPDRRPIFERLAWAQWSVRELEAGRPFQHLLNRRPAEVSRRMPAEVAC
jgi:hypothetical protein